MVDLHTHIIFGIDDGSNDIKESINIMKNAELAGFSGLVATPHYIEGSYTSNNSDKFKLLDEIKSQAKLQNINIDIYIGNEVFITENIENLMDLHQISSINNSKYILVELPMLGLHTNLQSCVFRLSSLGYITIIAHPERYEFVQKDPNKLIEFINQGVLFQLNSGSLLGTYGRKAEKTAKILLKNNMIHFIATDTHSDRGHNYSHINEVRDLVSKLTSKDNFDILICRNPINVINNKKIIITEPTKYINGLFDLLK
jgi:protein-tyrosine phosphatase